jgi:uncharacterized protein YecE (DUF72 family)
MTKVLIGISSWADTELVHGGFYPAGVDTPDARLKFYSSRFHLAEIDSSYHFFPTRRNLDLWLGNTPAGFSFNLKGFSLFTTHPTRLSALPRTIREKYAAQIQAKSNVYLHHLPEPAINELWGIFTGTVDTFKKAGKLGAVFFQFPPWFHPKSDNWDYLNSIRERLSGYPVAMEFQAGNWVDEHLEETLKFFRERSISLICVDEPQGLKTSVLPVFETTAPLGIVRFHGRNRGNWEIEGVMPTDKYNYLYTQKELEEWLPRIRSMANNTETLHLIFKNKHADYPVENAVMMEKLLNQSFG